jgi:hypothetical protein
MRNRVGNIMVDTTDENSDSLGVVLASYFDGHMHRPESDPVDDETGWGEWVLAKSYAAMDNIAEFVAANTRAPLEIPQATRDRLRSLKRSEHLYRRGTKYRREITSHVLSTEQTLRECGYTI